MRLREIPEAFQRVIKWAVDNKEALDITYRSHNGKAAEVTATVHDAKGERIWLVTLNTDEDVIFGYEHLLGVTPAVGIPVA